MADYDVAVLAASMAAKKVNAKLITTASARLVVKSSAEDDAGKTVVVDNGTTAYTGVFDSTLKLVFDVPGRETYTISVKASDGSTEYTTEVPLNWGAYEVVEVGLRTDTWQGLKNIARAGLALKYVKVGDSLKVDLSTGETVEFRVANVKASEIIFEARNALSAGRQMNASNTNAGGWGSSALRSYLNGTFFNTLPTDLQAVISERTIQSSVGSQSSSLKTTTDKIWIPREYEVFGTTNYAASTEHSTGGAEQFALYATASNRVKSYGDGGAACYWWLCSPYVSSSTYFCYVSSDGSASSYGAGNSYGVVPCFQISAS